MRYSTSLLVLVALLALVLSSSPAYAQSDDRIAPLLDGMGDHHHPITTDSPMAQRYFDQGLVLSYAFNHAEAYRSFREAARRDPNCAMCYWGQALVLGPNINAGMDPDDASAAWSALQKARQRAGETTEREQAYIEALAARYAENPPDDRSALDRAYADAMRALAWRYPNDLDAVTLFAEALMDTMPWDYWTENREPRPATREVLAALKSVMARAPDHPGANHFYIHTVEAVHPEWGIAAAERIGKLVPGAGHLVHMPSHIYIRVGRYHDGSLANERAIEADQKYITQCHAQGLYPVAYVPHNYHFLWATTTFEGRGERAIAAARSMAELIDTEQMRAPGYGTLQHYWITPLYALVRFGRWDAILEHPEPAEDLIYPRAVWRYGRAMAFLRTGALDRAAQELGRLRLLTENPALEEVTVWDINTTAHIMQIAAEVVAGELAAARGDDDAAIRHLEAAVVLEDDLNYDEPPTWHHPVRQTLGAVLLKAGQPERAEAVYREDLARFPDNGWSLYGLAESLRAQGEPEAARAVQARFDEAWQWADVMLTSSRL
jgi:tetratricopeptide (TPR) repeat protein